MLNEVTGTVIAVMPTVSGTNAKGEWKRAEIVISYQDGNYTNNLALDNIKNADQFAAIRVGTLIKVRYSIQSREHGGKWFTGANAVSWDILSEPAAPAASVPF